MNIDFTCDTVDCIYWHLEKGCTKAGSVTIQEHHCVDFEEALPLSPFIIMGISIDPQKLTPRKEIIAHLYECNCTFADLEDTRDVYTDIFGTDLTWQVPLCDGNHPGCVILAVREGFLRLPYNAIDDTDYELFQMKDAELLTAEKADELFGAWAGHVQNLLTALGQIGHLLQKMPALPDKGDA